MAAGWEVGARWFSGKEREAGGIASRFHSASERDARLPNHGEQLAELKKLRILIDGATHQGAPNELLLQMGKTRFQNRQRPTPLEEARSLIWYL